MTKELSQDDFFAFLPPYPLSILEFLKTELQLGKRYVVMDIHERNGLLGKMLYKHVHLLCSLTTQQDYQALLKNEFQRESNFLALEGTPVDIGIEDDSIDCIVIEQHLLDDISTIKKEMERVLRLNSYVLTFSHQLEVKEDSFAHGLERMFPNSPTSANEVTWEAFYQNGFQQRSFPCQQRFSWEELKQYVTLKNPTINEEQIRRLQGLFKYYEQDNTVTMEYSVQLNYGLFNHNVPAISLRKSIFFNILRPFAFGFYVLVKANIYFWKALFKIKDKFIKR